MTSAIINGKKCILYSAPGTFNFSTSGFHMLRFDTIYYAVYKNSELIWHHDVSSVIPFIPRSNDVSINGTSYSLKNDNELFCSFNSYQNRVDVCSVRGHTLRYFNGNLIGVHDVIVGDNDVSTFDKGCIFIKQNNLTNVYAINAMEDSIISYGFANVGNNSVGYFLTGGTQQTYYEDLPVRYTSVTVNIEELYGANISYSATNGTISGPSSAFSDDTVTLTVTPDTGYVLSSIAIYKTASQDPVNYTKVNDATYTFVMPDADVTVTGIFARSYTVSISCSPSTAATITRTPSSEFVRPGTTVSFTVTPGPDWQVSTMDFSQDANVQWDASTLTGTFTMPERLVYGTIYLSNRLDPNAGGGTSEPEVPSGDFDNDSDVISIPTHVDRGVVNVAAGKGLISLWNPTRDEIADIGQYLYTTDWADALYHGFRDFFVKPLESAISLHVLPIAPYRGSTKLNVRFGPHNSGVSAYPVTDQYKTVDLGTLEIKPYWDSYLDYNPYTKIQIYLPYVGTQDIDADIVMGKTVGVRYTFDVITGACVAFLYTLEGSSPSIFAEFVGESAMQIPLCSSDYSRVIGGIIQAAATVATGRAITGAVSARAQQAVNAAGDEVGKAMIQMDNAKNMPNGKNGKPTPAKNKALKSAREAQAKADKGLAIATQKAGEIRASRAAAEWREVPYVVSSVVGSKATTTISGSVAGGAGFLGSQVPYLIIRRPKQSLPEGYKKYVGYPSNIYATLGSLTGYTRIEQADLQGIPCTDAELAMIYRALKEGVYL